MKKTLCALVTVPMLAFAGAAIAAEPVQLSNSQMDQVSAGGLAAWDLVQNAFGNTVAVNATVTATVSSAGLIPVQPSAVHIIASLITLSVSNISN
jgi:hypothetical protein